VSLVAIAQAVAGRFDHYICRRDDNLRNRASDEVPRIQAAALVEAGVPKDAISVIPDEQEAIDAALKMGQAGDLLLIFADALARSWKQITKFKTVGSQAAFQGIATRSVTPQTLLGVAARETASGGAAGTAHSQAARSGAETWNGGGGSGEQTAFSLEGLIRDERGVRFAPEAEDRRLNVPVALPFDNSRRLIGANLFFATTGAVLELEGIAPESELLQAWHTRVAAVRSRLSWDGPRAVARVHRRGASRALPAPVDQLFVATEVNEWALCATLLERDPQRWQGLQ
jgi:hypothetical protein